MHPLTKRLLTLALIALAPLALCAIIVHMAWGMFTACVLFPLLGMPARDALVRLWSRLALVLLGIRVQFQVEPGASPMVGTRGALFVTNHVSWVDVFVICAVLPVRFVAKSEIAGWPVIGRFAAALGTVFVERGRRHAVAHVNDAVTARLRKGAAIGIFPEGTTSDGTQLLRFHANLIQPAIDAEAPVVPLALQYHQGGQPSTAAAFIGDMTLVASLWRILIAPRLAVRVHWLPDLDVQGRTRHEIAAQAHAAIGATLQLTNRAAAHDAQPAADAAGALQSQAGN